MIIRNLALERFMGYRKRCELDFTGKETIGIVGNNESGKSTLLTAISYLCFGDVPILNQETREVSLISDGATADAIVEGEVELPSGEVLHITRGRTRSNAPIVKLAGYSGKPSELSHLIESKLVSFDDFVTLSYFVQGDIHAFMEGNKREFFQRWAYRLKLWERYEEAAKALATAAASRRERLAQDVERNVVSEQDQEDAQLELEASRKAVADAQEAEARIREQVDRLTEQRSEQRQQEAGASGESRGLEAEVSRVASWVSSLEAQYRRQQGLVRDVRAGVCPVLKGTCDRLTSHNEERAAEAKKELARVKVDLDKAKEQQEEVSEKLRAARAAQSVAKPKGPDLTRVLQQAKAELSDATSAAARAAQRLGRAEERVTRQEHQHKLVEKALAEVASAEEEMRRALFLQAMCGRSGIPLEVMESELQAVEDKCNWVLERLDYPKRIRFAAYRELAGYEKVCHQCGGESWRGEACSGCGAKRPRKRKDEPTVTVVEGDVERPFSLESGGARVLQSFAVRLACSLFRASMTGAQVRMVMLDEVFAMLDANNRQKLMALVVGKLSSEFGLKQQFIVSHQEDVVNAVEDILLVQKRGGSSVARWA